jgi:hypothetical protein
MVGVSQRVFGHLSPRLVGCALDKGDKLCVRHGLQARKKVSEDFR